MRRTPPWLAAFAAASVLASCIGGGGGGERASSPVPSEGELEREVCAQVSHEVLLRTWEGVRLDRSGDIQIIPKDPNFVNGGFTHATPFSYTQQVPLFLYAPGIVRPGVYTRPITLADIAPTEGAMLGYDFHARDGVAQTEALLPAAERSLPRLLVTLVWDSGGMDVLRLWKADWPYLRSMRAEGAWFKHVTVGSSPSNTPTGHATIGTGSFPRHHGLVDEYIRVNGEILKPNFRGPAFLIEPTLADLYDRAMGNRPLVGGIATLSAHLMMMGHGSEWGGGDRDLAVTREVLTAPTAGVESNAWNLTDPMRPYYRFPSYVNRLPPLSTYLTALDRADGKLDGMWRSNDIAQLANGFDTPARTPLQTTLIEDVIRREGFGADEVPDLLYLNYKAIDTIGHLFTADSLEMSDAVRYQDAALRELVRFLNDQVGEGRWAMVLTADHGTQRDPAVSGAFMIDSTKLTDLIESRFDADDDGVSLVQKLRPSEIWLNDAELRDNGFTLREVSQFIMGLTERQTWRAGEQPAPGHGDDTVFEGALPSSMLSRLPCLPEARTGG